MSKALVVPDPIKSPVPRGWWEDVASVVIDRMATQAELDEAEAALNAKASLIESLGGDALEFQKALRVVEKRRGELLGPTHQGKKLLSRVEEVAESEPTQSRWRSIARWWDDLLRPIMRQATAPRDVSQSALLRAVRRHENAQLVQNNLPRLGKNIPPCPTIVLDPPWDWGDEGDVSQFGRGDPTYATMPIADIAALPVGDWVADDAHLYLWITNRSLPKGFGLLKDWGFRYVTTLTWVKPSFGMGNYYRGSTEHVLFGVRGSLPLLRKDVGTHFAAPRGAQHSAKPEEFYRMVETCSPGPWREHFARRDRKGWYCTGVELAA